eukprot:TRINITY_DN5992_c0_g1_i1.p3 TRINITY_DN5992_c0_g1~~TRINITY_DN5992_c0_g1_i1.p3  ORF type:complete len:132 (-),score=19.56 TRINITY_DN5992_c0_g1_i1:321-716(-)
MEIEEYVYDNFGLDKVQISTGLSVASFLGGLTGQFYSTNPVRKWASVLSGVWLGTAFAGAAFMFWRKYEEKNAYDLAMMSSLGIITIPGMIYLGQMNAATSTGLPLVVGVAAATYYFDNSSFNTTRTRRRN